MFKQRLISGIILVAVIIAALYFGGWVSVALMAFVSMAGIYEILRIPEGYSKATLVVTEIFDLALYISLGLGLDMESHGQCYIEGLALFMIVLMFFYVFGYPRFHLNDIMLPLFTLIYVGLMLSYIVSVRALPKGGYLVVLVFLSAWGNDTCAYCVGRLFGKHKMSPVLSPKKSIEGFVGGVIGAALLGMIYGLVYGSCFAGGVNAGTVALFAAICGIAGMISVVGDLAASAIKRQYEIKDYGRLIPGHGGIMDRFDSIIMTAPIVYYLAMAFGGL